MYFELLNFWETANDFYWKDDYEHSIEYYEKALNIKLEIKRICPGVFYLPIPSIYESMGNVYKTWGKYEIAIKSYEKQILFHPEEMAELLYSHIGIMDCYFEMEKFNRVREEIMVACDAFSCFIFIAVAAL